MYYQYEWYSIEDLLRSGMYYFFNKLFYLILIPI